MNKVLTKKRALIIIATALALILVSAVIIVASLDKSERETFVYEDFEYIILDDGTIEITAYLGSGADVNLPDVISGRSVSSIGASAFRGSAVTGVDIGSFTKHIGDYAFSECFSLKTVKGGGKLLTVGKYAFYGAEIEQITLADTITHIGEGAFSRCERLKEIKIPSALTTLSDFLFLGCVRLGEINLHEGITEICDGVFTDCTSLKELSTPSSVTKIGTRAFYGCSALEAVSLGASLSYIGDEAFIGCTSLSVIDTAAECTAYKTVDGMLIDTNDKSVILLPQNPIRPLAQCLRIFLKFPITPSTAARLLNRYPCLREFWKSEATPFIWRQT